MGMCWSSFRFVNKLKQPYRCIVKCGSNTCKVSIAFIFLGFIFLYFFSSELHGDSLWKRALAITGIVLSSISIVLFIFSCTICIFYIRLYKAHEENLNELTIDSGDKENKKESYSAKSTTVNEKLSTRSTLPIWNTRNSAYLYPPSAPPLNRMTPPLDSYKLGNKLPDWSSFASTSDSKSLSMDRNVSGDSNLKDRNVDDKKKKKKMSIKVIA